jgi:SAM-dependent methyltransferase
VAADEASAEALKAVLGEGVPVMTETVLPFKKKLFDVILVNGYLERLSSDEAFIEECHRCLKPDGRFIVHAVRVGGWSPVLALRRILGPARERATFVRTGYSETDIFNVLKHGFDVVQVRSYSRFFSELTDAIVLKLDERIRAGEKAGQAKRLRRLYALGCFCYWLSDQLDMLLVLSRGYKLVAIGKRRAWRPRNTPLLVDGRSISEAVLSKAGD